jgi:hypothetical protein
MGKSILLLDTALRVFCGLCESRRKSAFIRSHSLGLLRSPASGESQVISAITRSRPALRSSGGRITFDPLQDSVVGLSRRPWRHRCHVNIPAGRLGVGLGHH